MSAAAASASPQAERHALRLCWEQWASGAVLAPHVQMPPAVLLLPSNCCGCPPVVPPPACSALEMVFNLQLQVQLLLLEVEQQGPEGASQADAVLGVAAMGALLFAKLLGHGPVHKAMQPGRMPACCCEDACCKRCAESPTHSMLPGLQPLAPRCTRASPFSQPPHTHPVARAGVMFSATQTVQLLYRCVLRLLGTPEQHAAAEEAFAQSAAWGASVEAILVVS